LTQGILAQGSAQRIELAFLLPNMFGCYCCRGSQDMPDDLVDSFEAVKSTEDMPMRLSPAKACTGPEPQAAKLKTQESKEFAVSVSVGDIGLDIGINKFGLITITEVFESGGCALWNAANNSTFQIRHGDSIIEADGARTAKEILEYLQTHAPPLKFIIRRPDEFQVALTRSTDSDKPGLSLAKSGESGLLVKGIKPGMASTWNANNPSNKICEGDRIIAVNGVRGGKSGLMEALADPRGCTLDLQRHAAAAPGGA